MDFASLVLMEKDKETGFIIKELGSFEAGDGAVYVKKLWVLDNEVNLYFDTNKDVEEWEYSAIYDLFNKEVFTNLNIVVDEDLEEYNPTFILKFPYNEEYSEMKEVLDKVTSLINDEMKKVFVAIEGKEEEYK